MAWLSAQGTPAAVRRAVTAADSLDKAKSQLCLSLYREPPAEDVVLEDFERFAIARLRVLKGIEDAKSRGKKPDELHAIITELDRKHLKDGSMKENWRKDQISHFVLRLAHCRGEELRRWFLAQECELFAARFKDEPRKAEVLRGAKLAYDTVPTEAFDPTAHPAGSAAAEAAAKLRGRLVAVALARGDRDAAVATNTGDMDYFQVPFENVPDLVATRRVLLVKGQAYVARDQVGSLLVRAFRNTVSKGLALTARRWATVVGPAESGRLAPVVESLATRYLGPDYGDAGAGKDRPAVSAAAVPALAQKSFPLCMALLYHHLHADSHLKHGGRMQLGLFLKGIGLPLEEALAFWRAEFAPKVPGDKFNKDYAYNVRHNYGKEGGRKDYTPYSCLKIISSTPAVGDRHGCPYKTLDKESLRAALQRMRVAPAAAEEAVGKAKAGHYQLACGVAFSGAHGCACDSGINHPNQYFDESRKVWAEREGPAPSPATPAAAPLQPRPGSSTTPLSATKL